MKVALACPYAWDAPGGVQIHVRQLAEHLRGRGHQTLVLSPASRDAGEPGVVVVGRPVRVAFNGSVAPICPAPWSRSRIRRALEAFGPDVVHVHEPFSPSTGFYATVEAAVPVVATSHAYFERSVLFSGWIRAFRGVWKRPALWLAVSEASARFVRRALGPAAPVRIVPNGVDVDLFAGATEPAALPPGRCILFVNRLERRKGFAVALRALPALLGELPDALLVVAGDGGERARLAEMPAEVRRRVVMLGGVPHAELPRYHAACEAFVAPALGRESFGIVLVEAMAAGLPVVASDIPGYREVIRGGVEGLLVPPNDPSALAAALARVLRDEGLARALAEAGRVRAERFAWDTVASEVEAAYADALASR